VGSGPSPSPFTSENGGEILARHFATVDARELRGSVEFATRDDVEAYVRASISMASFVDRLPDTVAEPFVASTHITVFVVETAP
jgi:hypothetical protein